MSHELAIKCSFHLKPIRFVKLIVLVEFDEVCMLGMVSSAHSLFDWQQQLFILSSLIWIAFNTAPSDTIYVTD